MLQTFLPDQRMEMDAATREYFHTLELLKSELESFKAQQRELKIQIAELFEENKRLANELKESLAARNRQLSEDGFSELEQQYQAALASKNEAISLWQEALNQLEVQEEQLVGKRSLVQSDRNESQKTLEKVQEEYGKGLNILSREVSHYRSELSERNSQIKTMKEKLDKTVRDLETSTEELELSRNMVVNLNQEKAQVADKVVTLQNLLSETEQFLSSTKSEMSGLKTENADLSIRVAEYKEQNEKLKMKVKALEKDAKDSLFAGQEAIQGKREMAYREDQYLKEIEHLKQSVEIEAEKIILKHKAETKELEKQWDFKMRDLLNEIRTLHVENGEKQSLLEKAMREKQALESKLDLLLSESSVGATFGSGTFDDICRRLTSSERARGESELKVRSLAMQLDELTIQKRQEIENIQAQQEMLKDRLSKMSDDFAKSSSDRIQLSDESSKLKKKVRDLEKQLKFAKSKREEDITFIQEDHRQKLGAVNSKLLGTEQHYKRMVEELQKLLEAEVRMGSKWKGEAEDLMTKSEVKITELCQTIFHLRKHNQNLVNSLQQANRFERF